MKPRFPLQATLGAALLAAAPFHAQAQALSASTVVPDAPPPRDKSAPAAGERVQPPAKIQTVEIKGANTSYDARRDDTASKAVLTTEEIRKYGDDNIYDVLKRAPGVTITGNTIRMRGLGAGYTQILVNGDRPPPGFSLDNLNPDQIERIEIVRAASAEYSMQAIAGTVNIILRKLVVKPQRDLRANVSHAALQDSASVGGTWGERVGNLSYFLNGTLYAGRSEVQSWNADEFYAGRSTPDGMPGQARIGRYDGSGSWRGLMVFPRFSWKLENGDELNLHGGVQAGRSGWSGESRTENLIGIWPAPDYISNRGANPATQLMTRAEVNWIAKLGGGKLDASVSTERSRNSNVQYNDFATAPDGQTAIRGRLLRDWDSTTRATRQGMRAKYTRSLFDGHALATGIEASVQRNDEVRDRVERLDDAPSTRLVEEFEPRITRQAAWLQDEWSVTPQWSMYLGARWEAIGTESAAAGDDDAQTHSRNAVLSPVAQTLYKFPGANGRQLRLALTRTFKAPSLDQLTARRYDSAQNTRFAPDSAGNPALRPELANGIDVAYEQFWAPGALFSVSGSRRAITDYIRTRLDEDADGRWLVQPLNDGDALVHSLEAELKMPLNLLIPAASGVDVRASVTRNWSRVSTVPGPDNRLDGQTPLSANLGFDVRKGNVSFGASFVYQQGGWTQVSDAQSSWRQSRRDFDTYALWKLDTHWQLRLSLANILGMENPYERRYVDASGLSRQWGSQAASMRTGLNLELKM
jgi:outer membrane receptor for ferrienterochelin and colicins